jgi:hypothetical protein
MSDVLRTRLLVGKLREIGTGLRESQEKCPDKMNAIGWGERADGVEAFADALSKALNSQARYDVETAFEIVFGAR